jgi:hypothetical protein
VRQIVWVLAERPLTDRNGRFLRVVVDVDWRVCWPEWRKVYCDSVELMNPEQYPPRTLEVIDPPHAEPRTICAKCGRVFRMAAQRVRHEGVCGRERPRTLTCRANEARQMAALIVVLLACVGCRPPAITFQTPGDDIQRAQDRVWAEAVTNRLNAVTHCLEVQTRECMTRELQKQKEEP